MSNILAVSTWISDLLDNPVRSIFSPYTDMMGDIAYVAIGLPLIGAMYLKTRNATVTAVFVLIFMVLFADTFYSVLPIAGLLKYVFIFGIWGVLMVLFVTGRRRI